MADELTRSAFEDLVPAYLAGELGAVDRSRVEGYLSEHPDAGRIVDAFRALDAALVSRHDRVPPSGAAASAAWSRAATGARRWRRMLDALTGFPVVSGALFVMLAGVLFSFRLPITAWANRAVSLPDARSLGLDWVGSAIVQFAGGDMWMLSAIYGAVTIVIVLSSTLVLLRFLRS